MDMANTTLTSMASLSQTLQCNNSRRDVSFSSFLNTKDESFIRKLAESRQHLEKHKDDIHLNHHQNHVEEEGDEIGVFSAEKYFNSEMGDDDGYDDSQKLSFTVANVSRKYHQPKRNEHQTAAPDRLAKLNSRLGTPSVRSDSSCNSQIALIRGPLTRTQSRKKASKVQGKSLLLAAIGCNYCSCSDKESVDVHEELKKPDNDRNPVAVQPHKATTRQLPAKQQIRISLDLEKLNCQVEGSSWIRDEKQKIQSFQDFDNLGIGQRNENCFAFPALNPLSRNLPLNMRVLDDHHLEEPKFLKSPEVFGKANFGNEKKLPWDFLAPRMEQHAVVSASSGGGYNDNESDASSDLFEIESISGKVTAGCLTPGTCYAPSEASVDWSVVTASAADFSVLSSYEHNQLKPWSSPTRVSRGSGATKSRNRKDKELPRPGILMGCNSQKAVKVAGEAHKTNGSCNNNRAKDQRRMSDSYMPSLGRLQADQGKLAYGQCNQIASADKHFLHRSRSPSGSHHLYV